MTRTEREEQARAEIEKQVGEERTRLTKQLRVQKEEARAATAEARRMRVLYAREKKISPSVKAGLAERGEVPSLALIKKASDRELAALAAVRVTERKLRRLDELKPAEIARRVHTELRVKRRTKGRRVTEVTAGPLDSRFDFLLDLTYPNLFEPTRSQLEWTCKGCRMTVKSWLRQAHYDAHKEGRERPVATRRSGDGSSSRAPRVKKEAAPVSDKAINAITKGIEAGKGAPAIAKELNEASIEHPSGKPWDHHRVRAAYRAATGVTDWKAIREKAPLKRESAAKRPPRPTARLAKSSSKVATKASTKKTAASPKRSAAKKKSSTAASPKRATAAPKGDLAKADVTPHPKPPKREKARRGR